jgi:cell division transport system permease protein
MQERGMTIQSRKIKKEVGATTGKVTHWGKGRAYFAHHKMVMKDSLLRLLRAPFSSLMTWLVIGIALALPAGLYMVFMTAQSLSGRWTQTAQISLYLKAEVSETSALELKEKLMAHPNIASVDYVSREQALSEFQAASGFGEVVNQLDTNPLPIVIVIHPKTNNTQTVEAIFEESQQISLVEKAQMDLAWIERLFAMMDLGKRVAVLLGGVLGLGVLLVIGNTLRLAIDGRREEIQVIKLVGGTDAFIRRPFLYMGIWYGLGGGLAAWGLIELVLLALKEPISTLVNLYHGNIGLLHLGVVNAGMLLLASTILGWVGALLATYRHINEPTPE